MSASTRDKALQLTFIVMGLFLAGRLLGLGPLASAWSLAHWSATPLVALLIWAVVVALVGFLFFKKVDAVIAGSDRLIWVIPILFLLMATLLRFDSFAYGGGNLRIADFTQSSQIIYRWFEMGSVAVAGRLYQSLREFGIPTREAAVNGWVIWSLFSGLVSAIGATLLAKRLAESFMHRLMLSVIMLVGGHSLVLFGYTGVESSLPMFVIWFGLAANYYSSRRNAQALLLCWGLAALGLLFHISLLILIPGCMFLTLRHFGGKKPNRVPLVGALLTLVFLVVGLYVQSGRNLELQSVILLLSGKRPLGDYGLFSIRHLLDWLQLIFLGAPTIFVASYLLWTHPPSRERADLIGAVSVVALSGLVALFVLDPYHSVILDAPRLMAYLAPAALLLALLVADRSGKSSAESRLLPLLAVAGVAVLLAILPVYHSIKLADRYVVTYLDAHDTYYPAATMSFRDAHFHRKEIDQARQWEDQLAVRSTDYFLLRGTEILRLNGSYAASAEEQLKIVTKFPYWIEPRAMFAVNLMTLGQYAKAKPQIDTCLMLQPYDKKNLVNLYSYYRDIQDWSSAVREVARAEELYPGDVEIRTDRMLIFYRANDQMAAQVMADELLAKDSLLPFPYLVKGLLADRSQSPAKAISFYQRFVELAPKEPEVPKIQQRIDSLKLSLPSQ